MSKSREDKKQAIKILTLCAKKYQENLSSRSLLFLCTDKHKNTCAFEVTFEAGNFMHLTGCRPVAENVYDDTGKKIGTKVMSASDFLRRCLNGRLRETDFAFSDKRTTPMKLKILPALMEKDVSANQLGDYNGKGFLLHCELVAGNTNACLGIKKVSPNKYVPNSALNADIRDQVRTPLRIILTYRKRKTESCYREIVRVAKKVDWAKIKFPQGYEYLPQPWEMQAAAAEQQEP